jgi:hypothetical protein
VRVVFAVLLVIHGLIHLMGTRNAQQIHRQLGLLWLLAAMLLVLTAILLFTWPRRWWLVGAIALVVSQVVIVTSWADGRYGTIVNVIVLAGVVLGFLSQGPRSFRAEYDRDVAQGLGRTVATPLVTEGDLSPLPSVVQRYVRLSGAVG